MDKIDYNEFHGIKCRYIDNLNEYIVLQKQVKDLCMNLNKIELRIEAENMKRISQDEININSGTLFPVIVSWVYMVASFTISTIYLVLDYGLRLLVFWVIGSIICMIIAKMSVNSSKKIYLENMRYFMTLFVE